MAEESLTANRGPKFPKGRFYEKRAQFFISFCHFNKYACSGLRTARHSFRGN